MYQIKDETPMTRDFVVPKGTTFSIGIQIADIAGETIDITGWTFRFTMKTDFSVVDGSATLKKDITSHSDAINGETLITLSQTDTALTVGSYVYDIIAEDDETTENRRYIVGGRITIVDTVTQRTTT